MTDPAYQRLGLPATASPFAVLRAAVRALHPDRSAFVRRHGIWPTSLPALRTLLSETRQRGHAAEAGEVTPGLASVAAAVLDHNAYPVAGVALTFPADEGTPTLADEVRRTARSVSQRLSP